MFSIWVYDVIVIGTSDPWLICHGLCSCLLNHKLVKCANLFVAASPLPKFMHPENFVALVENDRCSVGFAVLLVCHLADKITVMSICLITKHELLHKSARLRAMIQWSKDSSKFL